MSDIKKIESREQAKEVILNSLEQDDIDVVAMANDILARANCFCGGTSGVDVTNRDVGPVDVRVTKTCGVGDDKYYTIQSGGKERWSRCVFREITIQLFGGNSLSHTVTIDTHSNSFEVNGGELR